MSLGKGNVIRAVLLLATVVTSQAAASDDQTAGEQQQAEWREEVSRVAGAKVPRLQITVGSQDAVAARLAPEPLLRWSNPTVGTVFGEVFVWTVNGRPTAIGSVYHRFDRPWGWNLELVSTSESPLRAIEKGAALWEAESAGVEFRPVPDSSPPSPRAPARLSQMRKMSARFTVELSDGRTDEEVIRQLRLLSQPLYRYSDPQQGILDGALFAVVEGTDPELWIILEAVQHEDELHWQYALARMDSWPMQVRLEGKTVQSWDKIDKPWAKRKATYTLIPFPPSFAAAEEAVEPQ
jgi:hypothetical protein